MKAEKPTTNEVLKDAKLVVPVCCGNPMAAISKGWYCPRCGDRIRGDYYGI